MYVDLDDEKLSTLNHTRATISAWQKRLSTMDETIQCALAPFFLDIAGAAFDAPHGAVLDALLVFDHELLAWARKHKPEMLPTQSPARNVH